MRRHRARFVLGMELASEEPRMPLQLDDLDELSVGRGAGHVKPALLESRNVFGIDFVAVSMAFFNQIDGIRFPSERSLFETTGIFSEPHRSAEGFHADQIAELEDHLVR